MSPILLAFQIPFPTATHSSVVNEMLFEEILQNRFFLHKKWLEKNRNHFEEVLYVYINHVSPHTAYLAFFLSLCCENGNVSNLFLIRHLLIFFHGKMNDDQSASENKSKSNKHTAFRFILWLILWWHSSHFFRL